MDRLPPRNRRSRTTSTTAGARHSPASLRPAAKALRQVSGLAGCANSRDSLAKNFPVAIALTVVCRPRSPGKISEGVLIVTAAPHNAIATTPMLPTTLETSPLLRRDQELQCQHPRSCPFCTKIIMYVQLRSRLAPLSSPCSCPVRVQSFASGTLLLLLAAGCGFRDVWFLLKRNFLTLYASRILHDMAKPQSETS